MHDRNNMYGPTLMQIQEHHREETTVATRLCNAVYLAERRVESAGLELRCELSASSSVAVSLRRSQG